MKCRDGRPTGRRQPDNPQSVIAPAEVIGPGLAARIEQRDHIPSARISGIDSTGFVAVADGTGQPEVLFVVSAALG